MLKHRMTKQKQLVYDVAKNHCDHPTADDLYLEIRALDSKISRATVYRNLEQLSNSEALLHVKVPGADRYDSRVDYHYHILCRECGAVCDATLNYMHEIDKKVSEGSGFAVERHRMIFEGLCPACQND